MQILKEGCIIDCQAIGTHFKLASFFIFLGGVGAELLLNQPDPKVVRVLL